MAGCRGVPIQEYFPESYQGRDERLLKRMMGEVSGLHKLERSDPNFRSAFADALEATVTYDGPGIQCTRAPSTEAQKLIHSIIFANQAPKITCEIFKAVVIKASPELLQEFRDELKAILSSIELPRGDDKGYEEAFDCFVGNLLGLLPFSYPTLPEEGDASEEFVIPVQVNGSWKRATYTLAERLELSPAWFSSPIPAYILTSKSAPPLWLFIGTTYPTGAGSLATVLGDATPGMSVAHAAYLWGKAAIKEALERHPGGHLIGISFGGATVFQVLRDNKDKVGKAQAFVPPGLFPWDWSEELNDGPKLKIYTQTKDLVCSTGYYPTGSQVELFHLIPDDGAASENPFSAHVHVYSGQKQFTMLRTSAEFENRRVSRHFFTFIYALLSPFVIFIPLFALNLVKRVVELTIQLLALPYTLYKRSQKSLPEAAEKASEVAEGRPPIVGKVVEHDPEDGL